MLLRAHTARYAWHFFSFSESREVLSMQEHRGVRSGSVNNVTKMLAPIFHLCTTLSTDI